MNHNHLNFFEDLTFPDLISFGLQQTFFNHYFIKLKINILTLFKKRNLQLQSHKMVKLRGIFNLQISGIKFCKQISKMEKEQKIGSQSQIVQQQQQSPVIFNKIIEYLNTNGIKYELKEHESAATSAQSAQIRNTPLKWGSKTMLVRGKTSQIIMLLYRANTKVSWNKVRKIEFIGKKSKMLTKQELHQQFGLLPGAVPPFVHVLNIKGVIDSKFGAHEQMAFNAGLKSRSIVMLYKDFPLEGFEILDITDQDTGGNQ